MEEPTEEVSKPIRKSGVQSLHSPTFLLDRRDDVFSPGQWLVLQKPMKFYTPVNLIVDVDLDVVRLGCDFEVMSIREPGL